eukprot:TRINITY_DN4941_c0_g1_i3.p1 TRINITY_DN4941_c0_g1~~TRINITY_DN4941_c0_g1_i3.p1  ORF type:complete len:277 (+),score=51.46 TRINITY_DN4941_c0_g1_i3:401-1231(+)
MFYWNQFSDEENVMDAETKIYTHLGPKKMRWKKKKKNGKTTYSKEIPENLASLSIAQIFKNRFLEIFSSDDFGKVRLVGHSLGHQLVVEMAYQLYKDVESGILQPDSVTLPLRIVLLDPYCSHFPKPYLNYATNANRVLLSVRYLVEQGVVFEQHRSSVISDSPFIGDTNPSLKAETALVNWDPSLWNIPPWALKERHICTFFLYLHCFISTDQEWNRRHPRVMTLFGYKNNNFKPRLQPLLPIPCLDDQILKNMTREKMFVLDQETFSSFVQRKH